MKSGQKLKVPLKPYIIKTNFLGSATPKFQCCNIKTIDKSTNLKHAKIISEEEIIYNDKERLLNKLNLQYSSRLTPSSSLKVFKSKAKRRSKIKQNITSANSSFILTIEKLKKKHLKYSYLPCSSVNNSKLNTQFTSKVATEKNSFREEEKEAVRVKNRMFNTGNNSRRNSVNNQRSLLKSNSYKKLNKKSIRNLSEEIRQDLMSLKISYKTLNVIGGEMLCNKSNVLGNIITGKTVSKNWTCVDKREVKPKVKNNGNINLIKNSIKINNEIENTLYAETIKNSLDSCKSGKTIEKENTLKNKNGSNLSKASMLPNERLKINNLSYSLLNSQIKNNENIRELSYSKNISRDNKCPFNVSSQKQIKISYNKNDSNETLNANARKYVFLSGKKSIDEINNNPGQKSCTFQCRNQFANLNQNNSEIKKTEVSAMGLLDDEEYCKAQNNREKMMSSDKKYEFINEIKVKSLDIPILSLPKFKSLKIESVFNIFSFMFDNFKNLMNVSREFRRFFLGVFNEKYGSVVEGFNSKYGEFLSPISSKYNIKKSNKLPQRIQTFSVYIAAKIKPDNVFFQKFGDVNFELGFTYKLKNKRETKERDTRASKQSLLSYASYDHVRETYYNIYKFDLRKSRCYTRWFFSEKDEVFSSLNKFSGLII